MTDTNRHNEVHHHSMDRSSVDGFDTPSHPVTKQNTDSKEAKLASSEFALPPADTRRWVISRKGQVVKAVEAGILTVEEACNRYDLTPEELAAWRRLVQRHGVRGLRVTQLRQYRDQSITP